MTGVLKDPSLPHQIVLVFEAGTSKVVVTCNCWKNNRAATQFSHHFGVSPDIPTSWRLYNTLDNHRDGPETFTPDPAMLAKYGSG